jgi:hypothetical protein
MKLSSVQISSSAPCSQTSSVYVPPLMSVLKLFICLKLNYIYLTDNTNTRNAATCVSQATRLLSVISYVPPTAEPSVLRSRDRV